MNLRYLQHYITIINRKSRVKAEKKWKLTIQIDALDTIFVPYKIANVGYDQQFSFDRRLESRHACATSRWISLNRYIRLFATYYFYWDKNYSEFRPKNNKRILIQIKIKFVQFKFEALP